MQLEIDSISDDETEFFVWLLSIVSDAAYAIIQQKYIFFGNISRSLRVSDKSFHKYINLPFWIHSKFILCKKLSLSDSNRSHSVLDIGAGPSHLAAVCRYFGHRYIGIDRNANPEAGPLDDLAFYLDMSTLLQSKILAHRTLFDNPVPNSLSGSMFDFVISTMATFCVHNGEAWSSTMWMAWFNALLGQDVITRKTIFCFMIGRQYVSRDADEWFNSHGIAYNRETSALRFYASQLFD